MIPQFLIWVSILGKNRIKLEVLSEILHRFPSHFLHRNVSQLIRLQKIRSDYSKQFRTFQRKSQMATTEVWIGPSSLHVPVIGTTCLLGCFQRPRSIYIILQWAKPNHNDIYTQQAYRRQYLSNVLTFHIFTIYFRPYLIRLRSGRPIIYLKRSFYSEKNKTNLFSKW